MIYGTAHFTSKERAIRYYVLQGDTVKDATSAVKRKLSAGEIFIGRPTLKAGETCHLDEDGRYIIDDGRA